MALHRVAVERQHLLQGIVSAEVHVGTAAPQCMPVAGTYELAESACTCTASASNEARLTL